MNVLGEIKKVLAYVDSLQKLLSGATAGIAVIVANGVSSRTLAWFVASGLLLGSITGFYFTASRWHGKGRAECLAQSRRSLIGFVSTLLILALLLTALQPELASRFEAARIIRELLLDAILLTNIVASLIAAYSVHCLIGAIVLHSPKLWSSGD